MTDKALTAKDRVAALTKLAESWWKEFDTRRTYEWKVNFTLWAALAAFAGLLLKGEAHFALTLAILLAIPILLINVVYVLWWTQGMHARNRIDTANAHHCWHLVEIELGLKDADTKHNVYQKPAEKEPYWKNWSRGTQITITFLFTILAAMSLLGSALRPQEPEKQPTCCCPAPSQQPNASPTPTSSPGPPTAKAPTP